MLTVIIPALNEEQTIAKVVKFCLQEPLVTEVIVVDDESTDRTRERARAAGATVLVSKVKGKGVSMKEGILAANNPLLAFLDADIHPYPAGTLQKLAQPLIDNEADFVKGAFARNAGRVTELVAKPLLKIFYPELCCFQQPLSGMIAGKKSFLNKIDFFHDYGVDVGILIDMFLMQARIKEVNIGYIENKSKPWQMLGKMSGEVARAIIKKANHYPQPQVNLEQLGSLNIISDQLQQVMLEEISALRKMYIFDMDNTLLQGRFIDTCAERFSFTEALAHLRKTEADPGVLTKRIASLLKGISRSDLLQVAASLPLVDDAAFVIRELRQRGNVVGIISDSYQVVVDYIKNKLDADFAIGNKLEFFEGLATGEVTIPSLFYYNLESKCQHTLCKTNAVLHVCHQYDITLENCVAIGDSANDQCMIENSGLGISFCTQDNILRLVADKNIEKASFLSLLETEKQPLKKRYLEKVI